MSESDDQTNRHIAVLRTLMLGRDRDGPAVAALAAAVTALSRASSSASMMDRVAQYTLRDEQTDPTAASERRLVLALYTEGFHDGRDASANQGVFGAFEAARERWASDRGWLGQRGW